MNTILTKNTQPLLIAGPCSAESEEQVMETARQLVSSELLSAFRAGVWKPRSQPGTFEGVGVRGLQWLEQVKKEFGCPVATEVANAKHIEEALKHKIDILWIGARTTTNPFAVQEIADALRGAPVEVLVKNPVVPDLALWIGGIERMYKAGVKVVGAVHRGFSAFRETNYRNQPLWQVPIELKQRLPETLLLCDPSHIGGKRNYLREILQKAADLDFDGWMIESHCCPANALSDAQQQITPHELWELLAKVIVRTTSSENFDFVYSLRELRAHIDLLDEQLIELLAQRMRIADAIGKQKKVSGVTILQSQRHKEILENALAKGTEAGLTERFVKELMALVHQESINRQDTIMNE